MLNNMLSKLGVKIVWDGCFNTNSSKCLQIQDQHPVQEIHLKPLRTKPDVKASQFIFCARPT